MTKVEILRSRTVQHDGDAALPRQMLSPIDASPLLLKTYNCPVLKFDYALDFARLEGAAAALLLEYPILGGRMKKLAKQDAASMPWLKSAPYCIDISAANGGVVLCEARTDVPCSAISLNGALAAPFSMTSGKLQLPPWYQPLDMSQLLSGKEPLLKLQLTHCSDGGSILAATVPHLLVDSHSSTLLLTKLSQLYRSLPGSSNAGVVAAASGPDADSVAAADPWVATACAMGPTAAGVPSAAKSGTWSKAQLLPADVAPKEWDSPATLKALSLELQSPAPASLGSALTWLSAAVKAGVAAAQKFPGGTSSLTTCLLNIPKADVLQLKAMAAAGGLGGSAKFISTNDAVSALAWLTFCDLRGRPLPGSSSSSSSSSSQAPANSRGLRSRFGCMGDVGGGSAQQQQPGVLGMAVDLRQNCRDLREQLPTDYFGNATWCLHVASPEPSACPKGAILAAAEPQTGSEVCGFVPALQTAAVAVRGALTSFRETQEAGGKVLQLIAALQAAPTSVMVRNLSRMAVQVDAFITSWNFNIDSIDFGEGPAAEYACFVRPTPPWQAAVLPIRQGENVVQLLLTVPVSAVAALKRSAVLQQLAPHATFMA